LLRHAEFPHTVKMTSLGRYKTTDLDPALYFPTSIQDGHESYYSGVLLERVGVVGIDVPHTAKCYSYFNRVVDL
jgi:hypothetical protein